MTCATPLFRDGTAMDLEVIWVRREQKYFCKRGWTGHFGKHEVICPSGRLVDPIEQFHTVCGVGKGRACAAPNFFAQRNWWARYALPALRAGLKNKMSTASLYVVILITLIT